MLDTTPSAPSVSEQHTPYKKKLIEVALPLQAINKASAREKSISHGHPAALHPWWARRPLAACRAVLFASLVDDPSSNADRFLTSEDQERERKRLFDFIEQLVQWENSLDERLLSQAHEEIRKSVGEEMPTVYDPFCGGGAIPIESQRLGLPTLASDLNPVAALITKALTEIPWRFKRRVPVHPSLRGPLYEHTRERATGLAADVEAYGKWMLDKARERIGVVYPSIRLEGGHEAIVIAWIWARTVHCPNPLCGAEMPLIKSFALSTKSGKEWCIEPIVDRSSKTVTYQARSGQPSRDGTVTRRGAQCIVCNEPITLAHIRSEGKAQRIGAQMIAIVANGPRGRVYLPPNEEHVNVARSATPTWTPETDLPERALGFRVQAYGMTKHRDLFTQRQLLALTTFSDLVRECRECVLKDAVAAGMSDDGTSLESGGSCATAYADSVATFLALAVDKLANHNATLCSWDGGSEKISHVFTRQTLSMVWDYAEANPLGEASGKFAGTIQSIQQALASATPRAHARVFVRDAVDDNAPASDVVSTDPPYYDNVPYADLSDFFYIWLRATLSNIYPDMLATLLAPKSQELVADPSRFKDDTELARRFFEEGLGRAFVSIYRHARTEFPTTIFYAFKQAEHEAGEDPQSEARSSVGWEAMLAALLKSGLQITGTWPMTSERVTRTRGQNSNALASSILLVCRPRSPVAPQCTRADFLQALRVELPLAVKRLRDASLAATDLEQAAIGPGMAVFSRYREVLEPKGNAMTIRSALALINQELAQVLLGEISEVDAETRFALGWFDGHSYDGATYGEAEVLLKAKNANLDLLRDSGVVRAERGVVQLLRPRELNGATSLDLDGRIHGVPAWAQLIRVIAALTAEDGGTDLAAGMLRMIGSDRAERLKDIAYHCYLACDRAKPKRTSEAQDFNTVVAAWPDLQKRAAEIAAEPHEERLL